MSGFTTILLQNENPTNGATGISPTTNILFDVVSDGYVKQNSINCYINGDNIYDGYSWDAYYTTSTIDWGTYDGYDGYRVNVVTTDTYPAGANTVRVTGQTTDDTHLDETYSFNVSLFNIGSVTIYPYEETIKIVFTNDLNTNSALMSCANYVLSNGAYVYNIELLDTNVIRLWTKLLCGHPTFRLTINNITNADGAPLETNYADFNIDTSTANIGSYNGQIATWRSSNFVAKDSQRVYLAGGRGIDVFYRNSLTNLTRWAQIFDGYNITALSVANFGGDLEITDTTIPYLLNQNPSPDEVLLATTNTILLSIADADSSVDLTSVVISVNDSTMFDGTSSGWADGYTGVVTVHPQQLDFIIVCPYFGMDTQNIIRVVAADLMGNTLTTSYVFYILTTGGFGFEMFGLDPFGGVT